MICDCCGKDKDDVQGRIPPYMCPTEEDYRIIGFLCYQCYCNICQG
jgi:hypothetical protein